MNFVSTWPGAKLLGKPTLNLLGGSVRMLGNMNRAVPSVHRPNVVASDVKPMPRNEPSITPVKKLRRLSSAAGLAASAWHSRAWPASAARRPSASRAWAAASPAGAFERGLGLRHRARASPRLRAAARMLPVSFGPLATARGGRGLGRRLSATAGFAAAGFGGCGCWFRGAAGFAGAARRLASRRARRPSSRRRSSARHRPAWQRAWASRLRPRAQVLALAAAVRPAVAQRASLGGAAFGSLGAGCCAAASALRARPRSRPPTFSSCSAMPDDPSGLTQSDYNRTRPATPPNRWTAEPRSGRHSRVNACAGCRYEGL